MSFWSNFKGNSEIGPGLWPYSTLQKLNINWLLEAWKKLFNYDKSTEPGSAWVTTEEGAGFVNADFVPVNGVSGQYLGNTNGAPDWKSADSEPTKSSENLVTSGGVYDALDKKLNNPLGREIEDYYIGVSESGPAWVKPASSVYSDTAQNKLVQAAQVKEYVDKQAHIPAGGNNGQVLTKTEEGYDWENIPEQEKTSINGVSGVTTLGIRNIFKGLDVNYSDYSSNVILTPGRVEIKENGPWNALDTKVNEELYVTDFIDNYLVFCIEVKTTNLTQDNVDIVAQSITKNTLFAQRLSPSNDGKWVAYNIVIKIPETEILRIIGFNRADEVSPENAGLIIEYRNSAIYRGNIPLDYVTPIEQIKQVPDGGTVSQVLTKTADGYEWENIPTSGGEVPAGGTQGQVLTKGAGDSYTWEDAPQPEIPEITVSNLKNKTNSTGVLVAEPGSESVPGNIIYDNPLSKEHGGTGRTDGYSAGIWEYRTYTEDSDLSPKELDGINGAVMAYKSATVPDPIVGDASSLVICHGKYETQILFEDGADPVRMFIRNSRSNATWSYWEEVILTSTLNLVDLSKTRWAPAQSGGLLSFIAGSDQAPVLTKIDTVPTAGSSNPITSGAVKTALDSLSSGEIANNDGTSIFPVMCDQNTVQVFITCIATESGLKQITFKSGGSIYLEDKTSGLGNWVNYPISSDVTSSFTVNGTNFPCLVNAKVNFNKSTIGMTIGGNTVNAFGYFTGTYEIS